VDDCKNFLSSSEHWADRAAQLGWDAMALFGCAPKRPLDYARGLANFHQYLRAVASVKNSPGREKPGLKRSRIMSIGILANT
jgi:hypothetical protein